MLVNRQRPRRAGPARRAVGRRSSPGRPGAGQGGPAERRRFLDDHGRACTPGSTRTAATSSGSSASATTLLKQTGGRLDDDAALTLDVWDAKLTEVGETIGQARADLVERLAPLVARAYGELAPVGETWLGYDPPWRRTGLAGALAARPDDEIRRQVCLVGPHRDELDVASTACPRAPTPPQGEQRTLALALRLAAHRLVTERTGGAPVLLLDDVFSELDPARAPRCCSTSRRAGGAHHGRAACRRACASRAGAPRVERGKLVG